MSTILIAVAATTILGILLGAIIGYAAKVFAVEIDPRVEQVEEALPSANCGGCGYAGCTDFAKALVNDTVEANKCPVCDSEAIQNILAILGKTGESKEKMVAIVKCDGSDKNAIKSNYNGISDCKSAALISAGAKGCKYGCLGLGSCARACPFGAIEMTDGLAIIHPELCVGCEKCVATCPKNLIVMKPASAKVDVLCNSPAKGPDKKKVCSVSCIGCQKCVKASDEGQMSMDGFLAKVNYENPPAPEAALRSGCPTGCLKFDISDEDKVRIEKEIAEEKAKAKQIAIEKAKAAKAAKEAKKEAE
jgi:electron transport complex protein RnfB